LIKPIKISIISHKLKPEVISNQMTITRVFTLFGPQILSDEKEKRRNINRRKLPDALVALKRSASDMGATLPKR